METWHKVNPNPVLYDYHLGYLATGICSVCVCEWFIMQGMLCPADLPDGIHDTSAACQVPSGALSTAYAPA